MTSLMTYSSTRSSRVIAAAVAIFALAGTIAVLGAPGNQANAAPKQAVVLGAAGAKAEPNCPQACTALAIGSVLQAKIGDAGNAYQVPFVGQITQWKLALGSPSRSDWMSFKERFGSPKAGIAVLRKFNFDGKIRYKLRRRSPLVGLGRYFGKTPTFKLAQPLRVNKGDFVALVVPTWAPALSQSTDTDGSWVVSRDRSTCNQAPNMQNSQAQLKVGTFAPYGCRFEGIATYRVRVESR